MGHLFDSQHVLTDRFPYFVLLLLFVFFFSVVGCFDAVALRLSRPTALIP